MDQGKFAIDYTYLRSKKARNLKKLNEQPFENRTFLAANQYQNATILPLKKIDGDNLIFGRGGVIDENQNYINESAIESRVQNAYPINNSEINKKNEKVVYCGYLVNHWGHFLVEAIVRLWYFLENDDTIDKYVFFIDYDENRELKGNYKEFFELLGILDKLEIINKPTTYKEVIIPELGYKRNEYYSNKYLNLFEVVFNNIKISDEWKKFDKIFLTRSELAQSKLIDIGIEMIDDYFLRNEFHIVSPEKISLSHFIYLLNNSKECATISGTLPHNMLFAVKNNKLIILERNILNNEIQADINRMKKLDVTYIDSNFAFYPVSTGFGPFVFAYYGMLEKYTKNRNFIPPSSRFLSEKYLKSLYKKYMNIYHECYGYKWHMEDYFMEHTDYLYEASVDTQNYFSDFLERRKPFVFSQYFEMYYIKQMIRRIIKK